MKRSLLISVIALAVESVLTLSFSAVQIIKISIIESALFTQKFALFSRE